MVINNSFTSIDHLSHVQIYVHSYVLVPLFINNKHSNIKWKHAYTEHFTYLYRYVNSSLKYIALNIIVDNSFLFQSISEIYVSHTYAVSDK